MKTMSKGFEKAVSVLMAVLLMVCGTAAVYGIGLTALAAEAFTYQHNPELEPYVMNDIVRDENAVYGYRPNETGSLKQYADLDWSDEIMVEQCRQDRIAYHQSIASMYEMLRQMIHEHKSMEEIAHAVSAKRNELRWESYKDDPEGLEKLKERNLEKYGHEEGPLPEELYEKYGSWEKVIEKAFSSNAGMDACLGLYDDYYDIYILLGMISGEPSHEDSEDQSHEDSEEPSQEDSEEPSQEDSEEPSQEDSEDQSQEDSKDEPTVISVVAPDDKGFSTGHHTTGSFVMLLMTVSGISFIVIFLTKRSGQKENA